MMAEAETEPPALDMEALIGTLRGRAIRQTFPLGPSILITTAERDAIIAALERADEVQTNFKRQLRLGTEQVRAERDAALERAARLEAADKTVQSELVRLYRIETAAKRSKPLCARATACGAILGAVLAPAPAEEGG